MDMINVLDKVQPKNKEQLKQLINYAFKHNIYNLNFIDTSKITDMSELFGNVEHDFDVSSWDVSNVIDISFMFYGCHNFNCDLSKWDVSNVTSMNFMFCWCKNFDGKGVENWNVENITDAIYMFCGCEKLNCDLSNWNIAKTTPIKDMFFNCDKNIIPDWY